MQPMGTPEPSMQSALTADEQVLLNDEGVPLFASLPAILARLESIKASTRTEGSSLLAQLVDQVTEDQALLLGGYLRDSGAIDLLLELLDDTDSSVVQALPSLPSLLRYAAALLSTQKRPNRSETRRVACRRV